MKRSIANVKKYPYYIGRLKESLSYAISNKRRARYIGYVGFGNLGDEAILQATREIFSEEITFYAALSVDPINRKLQTVSSANDVFLGGGTLIKATSSHLERIQRVFENNNKSRLTVFGTGVGDVDLWKKFGHKTECKEWARVINRSTFIGVRGPISKKLLKEWGVEKKIKVIGDPAVYHSYTKIPNNRKGKQIGINIGPSMGKIFGQDENYVLSSVSTIIEKLRQNGWTVTFFAMVDRDVPYIKKAAKNAGIKSPKIIKYYFQTKKMMKKMSKMDVFLGEKLHSVVLSCCTYTPSIMIAYRTKCIDFMESIRSGDLVYKTDHLPPDEIIEHVNKLYKNKCQEQKKIRQEMIKLNKKLERACKSIKTN